MSAPRDATVEVDGRRLETRTWGHGTASIVMLHDGLGSIAQWRDLPQRVHRLAGCTVLAYDRAGHGESLPVPAGAWPADWMHTEADVLGGLLDALGIERPVLVGHSDGASIALIHAATCPRTPAGVVALAPHSFVEAKCVKAISGMRADPERLVALLSDHHGDARALFEAWSGVWVSTSFASWDIRPMLGAVTARTLVVQGERDEYATETMLWETVEAMGSGTEGRVFEGLGHLLHHQAPDAIGDLIAAFVAERAGLCGG